MWPPLLRAAHALRRIHRRRIEGRHARRLRDDYPHWVAAHDTPTDALRQALLERQASWPGLPDIAIVMPVERESLPWAVQTLAALRESWYPHWTLHVLADAGTAQRLAEMSAADTRIRSSRDPALAGETPAWCAWLRPGDVLAPHALQLLAEAAVRCDGVEVVYGDHDRLDARGARCDPQFKSDWNPELLLSWPYIQPMALVRTERWRAAWAEWAADLPTPEVPHRLALRVTRGLDARQVQHIPHVLVHVRQPPQACPAAVQQHLQVLQIVAKVDADPLGGCRVSLAPPLPRPKVSVIVPTRDRLDLLRVCLDGVLARTDYEPLELIVVDNGSVEAATIQYLRDLARDRRVRVLRDERPFNFSALNNAAAAVASGDYLLLLNNDTEVIAPCWLAEMVGAASLPGIAAVGARLWYGDGSLQHAGLIVGLHGIAGDAHSRLDARAAGHQGRAHVLQGFSAVTAACLLVRRSVYLELGGFDAERFAVAYNDVDFCLRLRAAGHRIAWTPRAELLHHESRSRGSDQLPERRERFAREVQAMHERWGALLQRDPAYNPNLSLEGGAFTLAWPPRVSLLSPWYDGQTARQNT